ncbi:MAG: hypothetical protein JNK41_04170 [Saprospiraceae bacterium]|jgi:hypothetical protein|nr:hypothetical protein [Saprospiraceae bacterium]
MKKLFLLVLFTGSLSALFAQSNTSVREEAKKTTDLLTSKYGLNADQQMKMQQIQERRVQNARDFEYLKTSDEKMYYQKKKANYDGTKFSIERLLTEQQIKIFKKDQENLRLRRIAKIKELQSAGISGFELEKATIDIE